MSQDRYDRGRDVAAQRDVTRIALDSVEGFALAGSGAIREHGVTERPTEDVDLFTNSQDVTTFGAAVDEVTARLRRSGYEVEQTRRAAQYARLHVVAGDGRQLDVDLGVDWRQDDPVRLDIGPVLSVVDAVGNKVSALYSRGEPRDYLDVDAIRASGRFSDEELVAAAAERDPGFEVGMFTDQLASVRRLTPLDVRGYGVTAEQLEDVKTRCVQWADTLRQQSDRDRPEGPAAAVSSEDLRGLIERRQAGFPTAAVDATRPAAGQQGSSTQRRGPDGRDADRGVER